MSVLEHPIQRLMDLSSTLMVLLNARSKFEISRFLLIASRLRRYQ